MRLTRFLAFSVVAFSLSQFPAFADLSAQTLAELNSTDPVVRSAALRLRALDHQEAGRFEEAKNDFIACLEETRKTENLGREAEMFARVAYCQVRMGQFDDARANMEKAANQHGWSENNNFFLRNRAIVYLANDQPQKALEIAQRLKGAEQQQEAALALGKHFESTARYFLGEEDSLGMGVGPELFDPGQLPLNRAVALDPKSREAHVKRARYFADRANQKRYPNFYEATTPTSKGGWLNLIDPSLLDVKAHTFYQSAYYDWSRAIDSENRPADHAERALMGAMWNQVSLGEKVSPALIQNDVAFAQNRGERDPETLRALGRFYENTLPESDNAEFRPALRRAITNYSAALVYAPGAPENESLCETRKNLIGMFLSSKPVAPPAVEPANAEAWKLRGNELLAKNEFAAALECYNKALEIDPKYADALNNIGNLYVKVGAYDIASDWFDKAIAAEPRHRVAYYNIASLNSDLGKTDKAFAAASSAVQFAQTDAQRLDALKLRASLYYNAGQMDKAFIDSSSALDIDPKQAELWVLQGQVALNTGGVGGAVSALEKAVQLDAKEGRIQGLLAIAKMLQTGDAPTAINLTESDRRWLNSFLKLPKLDETYAKSPQKERLEQARKWAAGK